MGGPRHGKPPAFPVLQLLLQDGTVHHLRDHCPRLQRHREPPDCFDGADRRLHKCLHLLLDRGPCKPQHGVQDQPDRGHGEAEAGHPDAVPAGAAAAADLRVPHAAAGPPVQVADEHPLPGAVVAAEVRAQPRAVLQPHHGGPHLQEVAPHGAAQDHPRLRGQALPPRGLRVPLRGRGDRDVLHLQGALHDLLGVPRVPEADEQGRAFR
mmetsp:Transcript_33722/g.94739  ORF Transcript_33722/g.94739 Transcript_33722/m.94739 type:complete len:209 (+) Transcript_33722:1101-1727(+)